MRRFAPLLIGWLLGIDAPLPPPTAASSVEVSEKHVEGIYEVEGSFEVPASPQLVWAVLTDYPNLPRFVSSLRRSTVKARRGSRVLLEQEAIGRALVFAKTLQVRLDVQETAGEQIRFVDLLHKSFDLYEGSWKLAPGETSLKVVYQLCAKPRGGLPPLIGNGAFKHSAASLMEEVRTEILRRHRQSVDQDSLPKSRNQP